MSESVGVRGWGAFHSAAAPPAHLERAAAGHARLAVLDARSRQRASGVRQAAAPARAREVRVDGPVAHGTRAADAVARKGRRGDGRRRRAVAPRRDERRQAQAHPCRPLSGRDRPRKRPQVRRGAYGRLGREARVRARVQVVVLVVREWV